MDQIAISKHDSYGSQTTRKSLHAANLIDTSDTSGSYFTEPKWDP
jgi:hypothetical protein